MKEFNDFSELEEKQIDTKQVFDGEVLHVSFDHIELPNGKTATREMVHHIGAVCVIPVTDDGKVIIERQFRYPIYQVITEIPAGKLDSKDEDRLLAAKRELREETGYTADKWTDLGVYYPAPAYSDEKITMYMAQGLHKGEQDLDDDEFLNVVEVPLTELLEAVMDGTITDGKTQICIMKAANLLK